MPYIHKYQGVTPSYFVKHHQNTVDNVVDSTKNKIAQSKHNASQKKLEKGKEKAAQEVQKANKKKTKAELDFEKTTGQGG